MFHQIDFRAKKISQNSHKNSSQPYTYVLTLWTRTKNTIIKLKIFLSDRDNPLVEINSTALLPD